MSNWPFSAARRCIPSAGSATIIPVSASARSSMSSTSCSASKTSTRAKEATMSETERRPQKADPGRGAPHAGLEKVYDKPDLLLKTEHSLCPGCGEPVALRMILEVIHDLGLRDQTICVAGIGCYTAFPMIMDIDVMQALHGRAPSVATGVKRVRPDALVFTMQGDGDMISEGLQEVLHS